MDGKLTIKYTPQYYQCCSLRKKYWPISCVKKPNYNGIFYGCGKFGVYSILNPFQA
jgi:hypothetical protein